MVKAILAIIIWFILFMIGLTFSLHLISMADTFLNIIGVILIGLIVAISIETKCLTEVNLRKHEK